MCVLLIFFIIIIGLLFFPKGIDYNGRQVIVYVGKHFPAPKFDLTKVSSYYEYQ